VYCVRGGIVVLDWHQERVSQQYVVAGDIQLFIKLHL
jgi:hypothetical protein